MGLMKSIIQFVFNNSWFNCLFLLGHLSRFWSDNRFSNNFMILFPMLKTLFLLCRLLGMGC
jgi:hypothetical protein